VRVVLAFLADYAVAHPDGKVYSMGAGIDRLTFPSFPAIHPQLAVVLKFDFTLDERRREQTIQIKSLNEKGHPFLPMFGFAINPIVPVRATPDHSPFPFVYTVRNLALATPGNYRFVVEVSNQEVATMPLVVEVGSATLNLSEPVNTLEAALRTGYETFMRGDMLGALAIFDDLAHRFPGSPDVQNNLGFTLLAQGQPEAALAAFERAAEGRYQLKELLDANIACCHFLLGNHGRALTTFTGLLAARLQTAPVMLFLLGRSQARPVILESPGDYLALMALNAGRCAITIGQRSEAVRFAEIAQAGLLTFTGPPGNAETFRAELEELKTDIRI
jgi:hypothetical protein